MSLDNAIAIAAAANGNFVLITAGLLISIPIIVFGATLISKALDRLPWLGMIGAGLIGWIAGEVMADDDSVAGLIAGADVPHVELVCAVAGALLVLVLGLVIGKLRHRRSSQA
jgi:predicted tellurium resistance membrane protein TerC